MKMKYTERQLNLLRIRLAKARNTASKGRKLAETIFDKVVSEQDRVESRICALELMENRSPAQIAELRKLEKYLRLLDRIT